MGVNKEELAPRIVAAIFKALKRPEILRYMRIQIITNTLENIETMTDDEVNDYILWMKDEQAKEKR